MSLFSPDDLNAAFPEATPDALQDPSAATYEAMAEAYVASEEAAGRLAMTGGRHDAIGKLLDEPEASSDSKDSFLETSTAFQELTRSSLIRSLDLLNLVDDTQLFLELQEDGHKQTDWKKLEAGYRSYESLGLQPEVVASLEGQPLGYWQNLFSRLRQWQDTHVDNPAHKLQNRTDGDGLYVNDEVANNWDELAETTKPRWTISVVPGTSKPQVVNVDHGGKDGENKVPQELIDILQVQDPTSGLKVLAHPTIESYLTIQALRIKNGLDPLDPQTWSWLAGTFMRGADENVQQAAPFGRWSPGGGRVRLGWHTAVRRDGGLGARPAVRGQSFEAWFYFVFCSF